MENERTWMHIEMNMKGIWKEHKGKLIQMKGKLREMNTQWKEDECKMKGTWSVAEAPETNKTTPQSRIHFRACLGMDFGWFWLPVGSQICLFPQNKSDNHNNSNYSDTKGFDGALYCLLMCIHIGHMIVYYVLIKTVIGCIIISLLSLSLYIYTQ